MNNLTGLGLIEELQKFLMVEGACIPQQQRDFLAEKLSKRPPYERYLSGLEVLYASRCEETFSLNGFELMKQLAIFVSDNQFSNYAEGRSQAIIDVADRFIAGGSAEEEGDPELSGKWCAPPPPVNDEPPPEED